MKTFLHIGCGANRKDKTTRGFNSEAWNELRLDIDEHAHPDIVCSMLDMNSVPDASVDALYSSHNIEHLYAHEVQIALKEFRRVIKPDGFAIITCPDLQSVCELVAQDKLTEPAYMSPAGPITPMDILYGHRSSLAQGNLFMAHRIGFTRKLLVNELQTAGFSMIVARRRLHPSYQLWVAATVRPVKETFLRQLAADHFPR